MKTKLIISSVFICAAAFGSGPEMSLQQKIEPQFLLPAGGRKFSIEYVGKIKSALFGGEGLFFATLRGPGRLWLQSLPLSRMARRIVAAAPQTGRGGREEGSVLGKLGDIISGDRS